MFDVDWNVDSYGSPSVDSIKKYADNPEYKYIFINLMNKGSPLPSGQEGCNRTGSPARGFARACDSLQARFDISDKVSGSGTVIVNSEAGASLPDDAYDEIGMRRLDSLKLRKWGIGVERLW